MLIIRKYRESIKLKVTGIEAIKKQIGKEMELNKKLESFKQRLADDTNSLRRDCKYKIKLHKPTPHFFQYLKQFEIFKNTSRKFKIFFTPRIISTALLPLGPLNQSPEQT